MDVIARNKEVKKRLSKIFGNEFVSVRNGRGTAWGWCEIHVNAKSPRCPMGHQFSCYDCSDFECQTRRNEYRTLTDKIEEAIRGIEFYTYYDDMNYKNSEYTIDLHFRRLAQSSNNVDEVLAKILG